jgi:formimidoylglutamase
VTDEHPEGGPNLFTHPPWDGWAGPSRDPTDEQFGDIVEEATLDRADEVADETVALVVGEPYDGAVIGRRGAREGPLAIRQSLAATKTHHFDAGTVGSAGRILDFGDVRVLDEAIATASGGDDTTPSVAAVQERLRRVTGRVHDLDALPVFIGGDNSLTVPNVGPLLGDSTLGVVNFDAHLDCRALEDGPTSGTPYRQLFEAGLDSYVCVGARHFETSSAYAAYVRDRGGTVLTTEGVGDDTGGVTAQIATALDGVDAVYVSVDLDVLDATAAPGVSAPTPGGLTTRELFTLLRRVTARTRDRLAGVEIVECAPPLEESGRTADAGARALAHALAGYRAGGDTPGGAR